MKNKLIITGTVLMLAVKSAFGAEEMHYSQSSPNNPGDLYRAHELSLDVFGSASLGKYSVDNLSASRVRHNTRLGAGLGLTYFFTRNVGIGVEGYSEDTHGQFIDSASANVTARFPLGDGGFAPYVFGGAGKQFDLNDLSFGQAGGGIEYRFCPGVGVFTDARMVWPTETKYFAVARLGLRFAF